MDKETKILIQWYLVPTLVAGIVIYPLAAAWAHQQLQWSLPIRYLACFVLGTSIFMSISAIALLAKRKYLTAKDKEKTPNDI